MWTVRGKGARGKGKIHQIWGRYVTERSRGKCWFCDSHYISHHHHLWRLFCLRNWLCYFSEKNNLWLSCNVAVIWLCKKLWSRRPKTFQKWITKMWALLKNTFLKKCFDISKIIFKNNQTIDKISHWNLKLVTRSITTNITIKILHLVCIATGFHVKRKTLSSNSFLGLLLLTVL